jgi:hypothetical protein
MRICNRCRSAENPLGALSFQDSPEGPLCDPCYAKLYAAIAPTEDPAASQPNFTVITCPVCRGKHHASHGLPCTTCVGYGAVKIPTNALAIYSPWNEDKDPEEDPNE